MDSNTNTTSCPFCGDRLNRRVIGDHGTVTAIRDRYPVTEYHTLVIPKRHATDFFTMTSQERRDAEALILSLKNEILKNDPSVTGFNVGVNCGESAGQTIMHAHIHLIPRRDGDTPNPRGGIRGVIPDKMSY
ncbi:MAG: HIT family protein [Deltaproteobacteria bacterium]|nr:HIT family protein [Deltaproteobacteria bacterium]MBW2119398.1 HIT family protein [Deltaproteobacteria bacterium]MBW2345148.1 HIT family protein [Deltaproteobacteria bacterium]